MDGTTSVPRSGSQPEVDMERHVKSMRHMSRGHPNSQGAMKQSSASRSAKAIQGLIQASKSKASLLPLYQKWGWIKVSWQLNSTILLSSQVAK